MGRQESLNRHLPWGSLQGMSQRVSLNSRAPVSTWAWFWTQQSHRLEEHLSVILHKMIQSGCVPWTEFSRHEVAEAGHGLLASLVINALQRHKTKRHVTKEGWFQNLCRSQTPWMPEPLVYIQCTHNLHIPEDISRWLITFSTCNCCVNGCYTALGNDVQTGMVFS